MTYEYPPPDPGGQSPRGDHGSLPGGYPGMESMPAPGQGPLAPVARPRSIDTAVRLMYAGAVLSLLGGLLTLTMRDVIREQAATEAERSGGALSPGAVDAIVAVGMVFGVVSGIIGAGLWLLMAWANGKGRSWARIVATILFGLSVLSLLGSLVQAAAQPPLALALSGVTVLVGAVVIWLLWRKESSAYYQAQSAPRY